MSVCGILQKRMDFEDIYDYAKAHEKWFDKKLRLWNGTPSVGTLLKKLCYNIIKLDTRYDKINKNGNLVKLSPKRI